MGHDQSRYRLRKQDLPSFNVFPFIGKVVSGKHWVFHEVVADVTAEIAWYFELQRIPFRLACGFVDLWHGLARAPKERIRGGIRFAKAAEKPSTNQRPVFLKTYGPVL